MPVNEPEFVELRPSRARCGAIAIFYGLLASVFGLYVSAGGVLAVMSAPMLLVCGFGFLCYVLGALGMGLVLRFDLSGFEQRVPGWRTRLSWHEIENIRVKKFAWREYVSFDSAALDKMSPRSARFNRRMTQSSGGFSSNYGMKAIELAALATDFKDRAAPQTPPRA